MSSIYCVYSGGCKVDIIIRNSNGKPIYEQITAQIKQQILSDKLPEGTLLPSMRVLAKDLQISVITTKRAYDDLEKSGFILTVPGKGCFVAKKDINLAREEHLRQIEENFIKAVDVAKFSSITLKELNELLAIIYAGGCYE